jgi:hypothetical protein
MSGTVTHRWVAACQTSGKISASATILRRSNALAELAVEESRADY